MMHILLTIGPIPIYTYSILLMTAFMASFSWVWFAAGREGLARDGLVALFVVVGITSLIGARLMHFLGSEPETLWNDPLAFVQPSRGGVAFLGGVFGGLLGGAITARVTRLQGWKVADIAAAAIMLGLGIGRIGCFFAGCCHGRPVDGSIVSTLVQFSGGDVVWVDGPPLLALVFNGKGVGALPNQALYPTQLLESATGLLLFGTLRWLWASRRVFDGQVLAVMLVAYGTARMTWEGLRGDTVRGVGHALLGLHLSTGQVSSLLLFAAAVGVVVLQWSKGVAPVVRPVEGEAEPVEMDHSGLMDDV